MLYLLLDETKTKCFAKVGYTSDRRKGEHNSRLSAYRTHNPSVIVKDFHAGNRATEKVYYNKLLSHLGSIRTQNEWVEISEDFYNDLLLNGFNAIQHPSGHLLKNLKSITKNFGGLKNEN